MYLIIYCVNKRPFQATLYFETSFKRSLFASGKWIRGWIQTCSCIRILFMSSITTGSWTYIMFLGASVVPFFASLTNKNKVLINHDLVNIIFIIHPNIIYFNLYLKKFISFFFIHKYFYKLKRSWKYYYK